MNDSNSLELEPEVINQRDKKNSKTNENLSEKYNVDIYEDGTNKQISDNEQIKKTIYSNGDNYKLNTIQYLTEPYFKEVQEYPQDEGIDFQSLGNKIYLSVVFIQLVIIFYFIVMYIKKRRQKNENIHNKISKLGI